MLIFATFPIFTSLFIYKFYYSPILAHHLTQGVSMILQEYPPPPLSESEVLRLYEAYFNLKAQIDQNENSQQHIPGSLRRRMQERNKNPELIQEPGTGTE